MCRDPSLGHAYRRRKLEGTGIVVSPEWRKMAWRSGAGYSTCPDLEHAVVRSVGYVQAAETKLLGGLGLRFRRRRHPVATVHVPVQVEGRWA